MANRTRFAGRFAAVDYAYGCPGSGLPPGLVVDSPSVASGAQTLTLAYGFTIMSDGTLLFPLNTNAPINIGSDSNAEQVTPTAVGTATTARYEATTLTATFANSHGTGDPISSATYGLQEAINDANARGGGVVVVDAAWYALGGTATILAAATLPSNGSVQIEDTSNASGVGVVRTILIPNASVLTLFSVGTQLLPAPGAGNMYDIMDMVVENVFKTGAFASGGAIQASYGTGVTTPATATIAATFLTSPTANQIIKVAGALASSLSSAVLNKAITLAAATADFTTGAGSLIVKLNYRLLTGF